MITRGLCAGMFLVLVPVACAGGGRVVAAFPMQEFTMKPRLAYVTPADKCH